ncbi:uncharacterized protein FOMMEDRAFT_163830 [Fomitiporia mediterranea MF3/22]|uniref:Uncharacterized protein n=1 Tax=Fomitiporia mediterranea (strain MF3/22) TaxID=694068 RepID=R7SF45_FOMME|nr:uncharacterized protein FOMMEDRAFT_163830 [Fomitiporia mediterranea MF3/22]EJC97346.1 hypothetical protein FOMMEDRAFT_163830 [Fomitiporia mediterranea MF3/22]
MDVLLDHVVDVVASSLLASSAIGIGSCPRGSQGASDEEGNRHAAVDVEQEGSVPKIEQVGVRTGTQDTQQNSLERTEDDHCYVHRIQHSQLICLLEQPILSLHAMGNFDAPAKNMQQTDRAAQHTEWLLTADSRQQGRHKNKYALASVEIIIASTQ